MKDVLARIVREHLAGRPDEVIAGGLNSDGVPTLHGHPTWNAHSVTRALTLASLDPDDDDDEKGAA